MPFIDVYWSMRLVSLMNDVDGIVSYQGSSAKKGESLEDTVRCLECYADALVLRHPEMGAASRAADACHKPVLNAGDGVGEHPTQALLDLYTIRCELWAQHEKKTADAAVEDGASTASASANANGDAAASSSGTNAAQGTASTPPPPAKALVAGKVIALVGDLKHGRTVHSLVSLLATNYGSGLEFYLVSPPQLAMPSSVLDTLAAEGCRCTQLDELSDHVLAQVDVLYVTRVQKERFASLDE